MTVMCISKCAYIRMWVYSWDVYTVDCEGVTGMFIGQSVSNSKNWVHLKDFLCNVL